MRKFLLTALAVAMVAAPALAGDFTFEGEYTLQGFAWDDAGDSGFGMARTDGYYTNDLEAILTLKAGDVSAVVDLAVVSSAYNELAGHTPVRGDDIVDNYWITAKLTDGLTLKTGEYALDWGNCIAIDDQGGYNIALIYTLNENTTLSGTIGKNSEGDSGAEDADVDHYVISALMKNLGPFSKLNAHLVYQMDEIAETTDQLIGLEYGIAAGPVALSGEAGFFSGDNAEGNYLLLIAGLKEVVGFDLNVLLFQSSDDMFTGFGESWSPLLIAGNDDGEWYDDFSAALPVPTTWANTTIFGLTGSYAVNDKLTIGGAVAMITETEDTFVGLEVTEIDLTATYQVTENLSLMAGYGTMSVDTTWPEWDVSLLTAKATLTF